jgi:hypothetical protein
MKMIPAFQLNRRFPADRGVGWCAQFLLAKFDDAIKSIEYHDALVGVHHNRALPYDLAVLAKGRYENVMDTDKISGDVLYPGIGCGTTCVCGNCKLVDAAGTVASCVHTISDFMGDTRNFPHAKNFTVRLQYDAYQRECMQNAVEKIQRHLTDAGQDDIEKATPVVEFLRTHFRGFKEIMDSTDNTTKLVYSMEEIPMKLGYCDPSLAPDTEERVRTAGGILPFNQYHHFHMRRQ